MSSSNSAISNFVWLFYGVMVSASVALAEVPAPPSLISTGGEVFAIEDYSGQILLVNVWASWCGPCRVEMPDLDELQEFFSDEPFTVLGVAADNIEGVKAYLTSVPVSYPNYAGNPDQVFGWSQKLGNHHLGVPFTALIDTSGTIRWTKMGGRITIDEVAPMIKQLLEELSAKEDATQVEPE